MTTTFKDLIPGQTFSSQGVRYIKVSARVAYPLNANGVAVPSQKRSFDKDAKVFEVR